jgi:hypothetical protein
MRSVTFQDAMDAVESLPEEQRESLIDLVKRRLADERRDRLVESVRQAREEYERGEVRRGSAEDLFRELAE